MSWNDWVRTVEVEPSFYAADFSRLGEQIDILLRVGVRVFHFDVGDGHFIEPGYSGQEFMPEAIDRIRVLRSVLPRDVHVQVDGGIGPENIKAVRDAGATLFVAGTSIFAREDLPRAYRRLLQELA